MTQRDMRRRDLRDPDSLPPGWWRAFLAALFAASLAWRLGALVRLASGPLLTLLSADADIYWQWAGRIRAGAWLPDKPFFLAPLYPYWLAIVRAFVGDSIASVLCVQTILGAAAVVLVADATRRIASPRAGVFVGLLLAGYGMAVAFDLLILGECLLWFLGCLALWLVVRGGRRQALWVGALIGLMALGRPTFLLLLLPFGAYLTSQAQASRLRPLAIMLIGPVALVMLVSLAQWRADGSWSLITYSGGYNFFVGNGPLADGTYVDFTRGYDAPLTRDPDPVGGTVGDGRDYLAHARGLQLSPSQSSAYWFRATLEHARADPARVARVLLRKLALLFNRRELSQIIGTSAYARAAGPLGWPLEWEFVILGVGGILGFLPAWRTGPVGRFLCGWIGALVVGFAAFFVVDRYRIHLVPPLALLTAIGAEYVVARWERGGWRSMLPVAGVALAALAVTLAPLVPSDRAHGDWSFATNMGDAWLAKGEPRRAVSSYERAIAIDRGGAMKGADTRAGRLARAGMYESAGITYALLGDDLRSMESFGVAVQLAPEAASARVRLAEELALLGRFDDARAQYAAVGVPLSEAASRLVQMASREHWPADSVAMRRQLSAAAGIMPGHEQASVGLVRLEIMTGSFERASSVLRTAESDGLDEDVARAHAAWIRAALGDTIGARRILDAIPAGARTGDRRVIGTLELMRQQTGWNVQGR